LGAKFGIGLAPGGQLTLQDNYQESVPATSTSLADTYTGSQVLQKSLDSALVYRGEVSAEYSVTKYLTLSLQFFALATALVASSDVITNNNVDLYGNTYSSTTTLTYVSSPPAPGAVVGATSGNPIVLSNGVSTYYQYSTFSPFTGKSTEVETMTTQVQKGLAANDLAFIQVGFNAALTFKFDLP